MRFFTRADAGIAPSDLGPETLLLHIQNGFTALTPPAAIVLARELGFETVRAMSIDGVCAEPVVALELAELMLRARRCERVIVSAAVDFLPIIDPHDHATGGLFGAGAGALILERHDGRVGLSSIRALHWETHTRYSDLAHIPILSYERRAGSVAINAGHYQMNGKGLARIALRVLPDVLKRVLATAGWALDDVELIVMHQPNVRLLEIGARYLGLNPALVPMPVRHFGNMGPASLLVNLSLAKEEGNLAPGTKALLIAFGLGFSCGAVALALP
jgi:3-oxoacyl-[acyl-carrier-protein] synthase-3